MSKIKNMTSAARTIAASDNMVVSFSHLEDAIKVNENFQKDFKGVGCIEGNSAYN